MALQGFLANALQGIKQNTSTATAPTAPVPPAPQPSFIQRVINSVKPAAPGAIPTPLQAAMTNDRQTVTAAAQGGIGQIKQAVATDTSGNASPLQGAEAGLSGLSGAASVISAPLAPLFDVISKGLQGNPSKPNIMSMLTSNPTYQKFANSAAGRVAARILTDASNAGNVAGTIAGAGEAADGISNALKPTESVPTTEVNTISPKSSSYDTNLKNATISNDQAGVASVNAAKEASGTLSDTKIDLGSQFSEAPKQIMATDPTASIDLTPSTLDKLNNLKDTKTFALPDYLRPKSDNFGNGNIDISKVGIGDSSGIKLNPAQTQDLITQLDALTYKAKASGDLSVNQQTIGLVNDLKTQAQSAFGHVTDAQGNSVWNNAYQNYRQGMDAVNAMGDLVHVPSSPGEMQSPLDTNKTISKILSLQETPQGRAILKQSIQQFKNVSGYDLTDPIGTIGKLSESNADFAKALKGNYGHQFIEGIKNPSMASRRVMYAATSILGLTALGTAFRKQIGGLFSGQ